MLPTLALFLLLAAPSATALPGGTVLAWAPPADVGAAEIVYDVYAIAGGDSTYVGSTSQTVFHVPGAYDGFLVKYQTPEGEQQIGAVCVVYYPDRPWVDVEFNCG